MKQQTGTFVISLDFELYWGMIDVVPLAEFKKTLLQTREIIPQLLDLFRAYEAHATWATVGFLFAHDLDEMQQAIPERLPAYKDEHMSTYLHLPNIGQNEEEDSFHYGASLIELISSYPHQEIGTHTFSHYYCLEEGQGVDTFEADLQAAIDIACQHGQSVRSLVFPRNQYGVDYLAACQRMGVTAYRGNESAWMYQADSVEKKQLPIRRAFRLADAYLNLSSHNCYRPAALVEQGQPFNIPSSRMLRTYSPSLRFLELLRLQRITSGMTYAAKNGLLYHLWWHPQDFGIHSANNLEFLQKILEHYAKLEERYEMQSMNMGEVAEQLRTVYGN